MIDFDNADKNKSAFKLKGIGPIYYINMDDQPERCKYMESQFRYWEIETMNVFLLMMVGMMT
mgnify:CR=1 FL=1